MTDYINDLATLSSKVESHLAKLAMKFHIQLDYEGKGEYDLIKRINDVSDALDIVLNTNLSLATRETALEYLVCWIMLDEIPMALFFAANAGAFPPTGSGSTFGGFVSWNQLIDIPNFSTNHSHKAEHIFYESTDGTVTVQENLDDVNVRLDLLEASVGEGGDVDAGYPDNPFLLVNEFENIQNFRGNHRKWEVFNPIIPAGALAVVHFTTEEELIELKEQLIQIDSDGQTFDYDAAAIDDLTDYEKGMAGRAREVRVANYKVDEDGTEVGTRWKDCAILPIWYNPGNPNGTTPFGKYGRDFNNPAYGSQIHNYSDLMSYINKHLFRYTPPAVSITFSHTGPLLAGTILPEFKITLTATQGSFPLLDKEINEVTANVNQQLAVSTDPILTTLEAPISNFELNPDQINTWQPAVTGQYTYGMRRVFSAVVRDDRPITDGPSTTALAIGSIDSFFPIMYFKTSDQNGTDIQTALINESPMVYDSDINTSYPTEEVFFRKSIKRIAGPDSFTIPAMDLQQEFLFIAVPSDYPDISGLLLESNPKVILGETDMFSAIPQVKQISSFVFTLTSTDDIQDEFKKWYKDYKILHDKGSTNI